MEKGIKSTTMDLIASRLGISKRTLYEIFGSKDELIRLTLAELEKTQRDFVKTTFKNTGNVMEALIKVFLHTRDAFEKINADFFRDLDLYKEQKKSYEETRCERNRAMLLMFKKGVAEGMFRPDVNYEIQSRVMGIQMESLKRMEELFPADIHPLQVYDSIIVGFLRGIASEKGMRILDELTKDLTIKKQIKNI